jgi:Transcriptional activator HlyU
MESARCFGGAVKEHRFIRAETHASHKAAVEFSIANAKQIIDEQGPFRGRFEPTDRRLANDRKRRDLAVGTRPGEGSESNSLNQFSILSSPAA